MKKECTIGIICLFLVSAVLPFCNGLNAQIKNEGEPQLTTRSNDPMDSAWPMKCHDIHHTGQSQYSTADNQGGEKWRYSNDFSYYYSPISSFVIDREGVIYFNGDLGDLYAMYPNGTLKWKYDGATLATPAINDDGTIYTGSRRWNLNAFNPNGTIKWMFKLYGEIHTSPVIADDGTIYFGTCEFDGGKKIYAVNPNGTEKWNYLVGDSIHSDPCIGDDGTIYIGCDDTYLYAMYPNGTLRWRFKTEGAIGGSPSIAVDGTIYIGSSDGYLYALFPDGRIKWKYNFSFNVMTNPSIATDGTIYIGWDKLYALYPNGALKWSFNMGVNRSTVSSPAISADGTIFIGTQIGTHGGGELLAVNPNGTEKWRILLTDCWIRTSPCIDEDGTVYIRGENWSTNGYFFAINVAALKSNTGGPYYGLINTPIQFNGSGSGGYKPLRYHWTFSDSSTSAEQNPVHLYKNPGNYTITFTVTDGKGYSITNYSWSWIQSSNTPPGEPIISGLANGTPGVYYNYSFICSDESVIWYYVVWGDGLNSGWIGPYNPDEILTLSHVWSGNGNYTIRAKAKDPYNEEGPWGTLVVTIPCSYNRLVFQFWERLLERFPNTFPLLRQLIGC